MYMYFWLKNKKLNIKNLPTKPMSGGNPDIDKIVSTTDIEIKLYLLKIFNELVVFIFFRSNKNSKEKNIYNI